MLMESAIVTMGRKSGARHTREGQYESTINRFEIVLRIYSLIFLLYLSLFLSSFLFFIHSFSFSIFRSRSLEFIYSPTDGGASFQLVHSNKLFFMMRTCSIFSRRWIDQAVNKKKNLLFCTLFLSVTGHFHPSFPPPFPPPFFNAF